MIEAVKQAPPPPISTINSGGDTHRSSYGGFGNSRHDGSFHQVADANKLDKNDVKSLVEDLNKTSDSLEVAVKFAFNDKLGEVYVNVVDKNSGEVIRQLPSKEALKLKEAMKEFIGSIFDMKG